MTPDPVDPIEVMVLDTSALLDWAHRNPADRSITDYDYRAVW